jgi:hypothetical protein
MFLRIAPMSPMVNRVGAYCPDHGSPTPINRHHRALCFVAMGHNRRARQLGPRTVARGVVDCPSSTAGDFQSRNISEK